MSVNIIALGRFLMEGVAELTAKVPALEKRFSIKSRIDGPWPKGPFLWLHGASMGECKMLLNLADALLSDVNDCPAILLTTQKVEVLQYFLKKLEQSKSSRIQVSMAPIDSSRILKGFLQRTQPVGLILGENELWPGFLSGMKRFCCRPSVALVSGRFKSAVPGIDFSALGYACMQTALDKDRFQKAAAQSLQISVQEGGDWKLLPWSRQEPIAVAEGEEKKRYDVAFVSIHVEEMSSLQSLICSVVSQNKSCIFVPRRLEELKQIRRNFEKWGVPVVEWPESRRGAVSIVDCFGRVQEILRESFCAVVGGSFHKKLGIHDFWEPLQMGLPTFVGPYCRGHEGAVEMLLHEGALYRLQEPGEMTDLDMPDKACVERILAKEREKILNSYGKLKRFVEELQK